MNSKYYVKYQVGVPESGSILVYDAEVEEYVPSYAVEYLEAGIFYPITDLVSIIGTPTKKFKDIYGHKLVLYNSSSNYQPEINFQPVSGSSQSWQIKTESSGSTTVLAFYFFGTKKVHITPTGDMVFFTS